MNRWSVALLLGALVPMGAAPLLSRAAVDPIAMGASSVLGNLARSLPNHPRTTPVGGAAPRAGRHMLHRRVEPARSSVVSRHRAAMNRRPVGGILARRQLVLAAVRSGIRPSASHVAAEGDRPAGLIVHGWSAAGVGFAEGDIITRVGGRTPTSVDDVIVAVAGAYKSKSYVVGGQIWRNGRLLNVTVELPIPRRKKKASGETPR